VVIIFHEEYESIFVTLAFAAFFCIRLMRWVYKRWLNRREIISGICPICGYNLTGNTSGVCPECGTSV
jgi:hypothetical protein